MINHEQRREFKKNAKKHGFSDFEINYILNHKPNSPLLWEGAKVKLDEIWMKFSPDWIKNHYSNEYKKFIIDNKDKVFTVEFDPIRKRKSTRLDINYDSLVCLTEDITEPKWFFFAGDLILQEGGTSRPKTKEELNKNNILLEKINQESKIKDAVQLALEREKNGD